MAFAAFFSFTIYSIITVKIPALFKYKFNSYNEKTV